MNRVEWLDKAFLIAGLTLDDYLFVKGLEETQPRKFALCSARDAMKYLGVSKNVFYELKKEGFLPYVAIGKKHKYSYKALDDLIELNTARGKAWDLITNTADATTTTAMQT